MNLDFERPDDEGSQTTPSSNCNIAPSGICMDMEAVSGILPLDFKYEYLADKIDMEFNISMYSSSIKKKDEGFISKFKRYLFGE